MLKLGEMENCPFFIFLIYYYFFEFFLKKNKIPSQTYQEKPNIQPSPWQRRQNLISPQAHGGVVAFQGRSCRDYHELLGYNLSKFARQIQI